jgi:hypothetical protein
MVSSSRLLQRLSVTRWLLGLALLVTFGSGWACADPAAGAGQRIGRMANRTAVVQVADRVALDLVARGADLQGLAGLGAARGDHPCGHADATAGAAPDGDPCSSPHSPCAGLCGPAGVWGLWCDLYAAQWRQLQAQCTRLYDGLAPARHAQLAVEMDGMLAHCFRRNPQLVRDLLVRQPLAKQGEHVHFAIGEQSAGLLPCCRLALRSLPAS